MAVFLLWLTLAVLFIFLFLGKSLDSTLRAAIVRAGTALIGAVAGFFVGIYIFLGPLSGIFLAVLGWVLMRQAQELLRVRRIARIKTLAKDFVTGATGMYLAGQTTAEVIASAAHNLPHPLAGDFQSMLGRRTMQQGVTFPVLFEELAERYQASEFRAVAQIIAFGETMGGSRAIGQALARLGTALRRRDRLYSDRMKAVAEPALAAFVVIAILSLLLVLDALFARRLFASSLAGRTDMGLGVGVITGLIIMALRVSQNKDLI